MPKASMATPAEDLEWITRGLDRREIDDLELEAVLAVDFQRADRAIEMIRRLASVARRIADRR